MTGDKVRAVQKWNKTALFFVFHLHLFGVLIMLQNVSESLFYSTVGVTHLPSVRVVMAITMLPLTILYDRLTTRGPNSKYFAPILTISATAVLILGISLFFAPWLAAFALMVASPMAQAFLLAEFWNLANNYFTIRESKRAFPLLFGAASLGGILAGFATSTLVAVISTENLLLVCFVLTLLGLNYLKSIREHLTPIKAAGPPKSRPKKQQQRKSWQAKLRDFFFAKPLVTGIIGLSFVGSVVLYLAEYAYFDIFSKAYPETDDLTEFLGFWSAVSSGINLALAFFIMPKLPSWLGVRNVTLIQPALALFVFIGLFTAPLLAVGVAAYLAILSRNVIEETNEQFLYKGLPSNIAQIVRGRSEGAVKPIAAISAASLLFLFGDQASPLLGLFNLSGSALAVAAAGAVVALTYIGFALIARSAYPKAIVERIRTRTFSIGQLDSELALEGGESRALLEQQLESEDAELVRFAAENLYAADPDLAIARMKERLSNNPRGNAAELLTLLAEWGAAERAPETLTPFLNDNQEAVRAAALRALATLPERDNAPIMKALEDPSLIVRKEAVAALCADWDLENMALGLHTLNQMLACEDLDSRAATVSLVGRLQDPRHLRVLTPLISDPEDTISLKAARTIDENVGARAAFLVDELTQRLNHPKQVVRSHLVNALLKIGDPSASQALVDSGDGVPARMRERAAHFLAAHPEISHPILSTTLTNPQRPHGNRILAANALSLGGKAHKTLLKESAIAELTEAYRTLRDAHLLEHSKVKDEPSLELLLLALSDRRQEALELVIEIIGFPAQHPDFNTIRTYCFSTDPVARSYAIEALEGIAERQLFELLLPFLTIDPNDEVELALGTIGTRLGLDQQDDDVISRRLEDEDPWVCACALHVAACLNHPEASRVAKSVKNTDHPLLAETAKWVLNDS